MLIVIASTAVAIAGLITYVLLIIGTHREAPHTALRPAPSTRLAALARRVLNVYVQRPTEADTPSEAHELTTGRR